MQSSRRTRLVIIFTSAVFLFSLSCNLIRNIQESGKVRWYHFPTKVEIKDSLLNDTHPKANLKIVVDERDPMKSTYTVAIMDMSGARQTGDTYHSQTFETVLKPGKYVIDVYGSTQVFHDTTVIADHYLKLIKLRAGYWYIP